MRKEGSRAHHPERVIEAKKLVWLVACLLLALVATVGTIWYNLRRADQQTGQPSLFGGIVNKVQESINSSASQ
jgi:hypothetical protein